MHGFLNLDKPAGITSHDVVARVRRLLRERRVGHAGTLDPAATGVLVVAVGQATRLIEYVQEETQKGYQGILTLGISTATDDAEGEIVERAPVPALDEVKLRSVLAQFIGDQMQVPPMYSALHHQGRRLHELARAGVTVDLAARPVRIDQIELLSWSPPFVTIDVRCGKGTYIRALARDIGAALGCGAHLSALRRTAVGSFLIGNAWALDRLEQAPEPRDALLPPETAVAGWPVVVLTEGEMRLIRNGMSIDLPDTAGQRTRAHRPDGALLALLTRQDGLWRPEKVFDWS
jgi:tRNA pseudouridine55 synthase